MFAPKSSVIHNAGCQGILVKTGFGKQVLSGAYRHHTQPDFIAQDLIGVVG